jgi:iron-sulfur cluster assembly accessory protein
MASADGMQCQAQDAKFSQLNERIATTQCTRQCRQKWDICDFCIPTKNGVSLLIDAMSYQYLVGAEIDYKDDLQGAQFVIKNPNANSTCGCGSSFS